MPVFAQQGHHFGHCTPLVDTDQRSATLVFGGDKAQTIITLMNRPCSRAMDSMEEMEEIGPKNLRPPAISPMVRERREASARAELEGR